MNISIPIQLAAAALKAGGRALKAVRPRSGGGQRITRRESREIADGLRQDAERILDRITDRVEVGR